MIRLIGYGNPGRGDDGLGPAFAARVGDVPGLSVSTDYQLTVDHALLVAEAEQVVFVDASISCDTSFSFGPIERSETGDVSSHSLAPGAVLALSATLFGTAPEAYVLGIAGYEFGQVCEGLSAKARANLDQAETFFRAWIIDSGGRNGVRGPT